MTQPSAPPGWYPDPGGYGQRYFDGVAWTEHVNSTPQGGPGWQYGTPWKGQRLGLPASGPGALANPGARLAARMLDGLVFLPVYLLFAAVAILVAAPNAGEIFPPPRPDGEVGGPTPGIVWLMLAAFVGMIVANLVFIAYETIMVHRSGQTLGKKWMKIKVVKLHGEPLEVGTACGRSILHWLSGILGWIGMLNVLWCLWDDDRQCVHDKIVSTYVVNV